MKKETFEGARNKKLLSVKEAAALLETHPNTVYRLVRKERVPYLRIPGIGLRFKKTALSGWLEKHSHKSLSDIFARLGVSLDGYVKLSLKWRTELKDKVRWTYSLGSVIQRKTKNEEARFYIDFQIDGRRVREALKGVRRKTEAEKILSSKVADVLSGRYNLRKEVPEITFREMSDLYLEKYAKVNKKSWKTSDWIYLKPLERFFGSSKLSEITPEMLEDYRKERLETVKKSTVNREMSCLRKIFNVAINWGYVSDNPVRKVKFFSEKENLRERILIEEEEWRLLEESPSYLRPILIVALHTGMRKGEIFKLKWANVDFGDETIRIPEAKSGRERRVWINSVLFELLSVLSQQNGDSEFMFTNPETGKPYVDIKRAFNGACERAGIKELRFHDLRHTFASRLVKKGIDLERVKELMGHSSIVTTQRYLHSSAKEKREAVETLVQKPQVFDLCQKSVKSVVAGVRSEALNLSFSNN